MTLRRLGVDIGGSTIRLAAIDMQYGSVVSHIQSVPMPKKARPEQVFEILFQSS
ncbi:MAG: ROK family protein [Gammaproteobacteria bacterium]|nr:ROK family protein [Gammaproteobacteria bacterium]